MQGEVDVFYGFDGVAAGDVVLVEEAVGAVAGCPDFNTTGCVFLFHKTSQYFFLPIQKVHDSFRLHSC